MQPERAAGGAREGEVGVRRASRRQVCKPPQLSLQLSVGSRISIRGKGGLSGLGLGAIPRRLVFAKETFSRGFREIMKQLPTRHPRSLRSLDLRGRQVGAGRGADAGPKPTRAAERQRSAGGEPARPARQTWRLAALSCLACSSGWALQRAADGVSPSQ